MKQKVAIVLLNWNGGQDTVECIQSIKQNIEQGIHIYIVDNASEDDSLVRIRYYLQSQALPYNQISQAAIEQKDFSALEDSKEITLILNKANLGFAGGNNVAMRLVLAQESADFIWLLNNDARIQEDTLSELLQVIESDQKIGFAGSVLMDYHQKDLIQCAGCKVYKYLGITKMYLKNQPYAAIEQAELDTLDYQMGASLLVRCPLIREVGLMDESFFLYFEENDWQLNAQKHQYLNRLSPKSKVYHKGSLSTKDRKHMFYFYYNRASILFFKKQYPLLTRVIALGGLLLVTVLKNIGRPKNIYYGIKGVIEGVKTAYL